MTDVERIKLNALLDEIASDGNAITDYVCDWARDCASIQEAVDALESASGSYGSFGDLIYTRDIAGRLRDWFTEIEDFLEAYENETGQQFAHSNSLARIVWSAVEWEARDVAFRLRRYLEDQPECSEA